jgi:hypothetical protein
MLLARKLSSLSDAEISEMLDEKRRQIQTLVRRS